MGRHSPGHRSRTHFARATRPGFTARCGLPGRELVDKTKTLAEPVAPTFINYVHQCHPAAALAIAMPPATLLGS